MPGVEGSVFPQERTDSSTPLRFAQNDRSLHLCISRYSSIFVTLVGRAMPRPLQLGIPLPIKLNFAARRRKKPQLSLRLLLYMESL